MIKYYSLNEYLRDTFGCKVYKLALDGGFTCPNRDGRAGYGGCIFCSAAGSGDFTLRLGIREQLLEAKKRISGKHTKDIGGYIAYFQSFTGTYAPAEKLRRLYMEAAAEEDIVALSIATRPDCLGEEVLEVISEINQIKPVWIELGLQTIHERSAEYIRRGYPLEVYDRAVSGLYELGISQIITHVILGLPGETREDMLATVRYVAESHSNGIKLQLLHVLEGTDLAKEYRKGLFKVLEMEEYIDILKEAVGLLPENMVVHRLTGDGPKKDLIAPKWSGDKKRVLNAIKKKFEE